MRITFFWLILLLSGTAHAAGAAPTLLVFGDSLSAGYGIPRESGWVNLLARRLAGRVPPLRVVNASVSGETTAGGLTRLPEVLALHHPSLTVLALGANDGLRGLPPEETARNLTAMIRLAQQRGSAVLLVGMQLPPNYGSTYTGKFLALYAKVAKASRVSLAPFLLEGMAGQRERFQADGLHPDAQAQPVLLNNVWKALEPMLAHNPRNRSD